MIPGILQIVCVIESPMCVYGEREDVCFSNFSAISVRFP